MAIRTTGITAKDIQEGWMDWERRLQQLLPESTFSRLFDRHGPMKLGELRTADKTVTLHDARSYAQKKRDIGKAAALGAIYGGDDYSLTGGETQTVGRAARQRTETIMRVAVLVQRIREGFDALNMPQGARDAAFEVVMAQFAILMAEEMGPDFDSFEFVAACRKQHT